MQIAVVSEGNSRRVQTLNYTTDEEKALLFQAAAGPGLSGDCVNFWKLQCWFF